MLRAPRTREQDSSVDQYLAAWHSTMKLLREGHSFSGREANCAFLNCGNGRFANWSAATGLDFTDDGRAIGVVDWDHDGDLDLWLHNRTGPRLRLMLNQCANGPQRETNFLQVRLRGTDSNRDAIGARVELLLKDKSAGKLIQTLYAGDAYISQSSKWLHFGLGNDSEIEQLVVRWPSGQVESFSGLSANVRFLLVEGSGKPKQMKNRSRLALESSEQRPQAASLATRTMLVNRLPLPILKYTDETQTYTFTHEGEPILLCFWASWCKACLNELTELTDHADCLREQPPHSGPGQTGPETARMHP